MRAWRWAALPLSVYLVAFAAMTFPSILSFNTSFFCDSGDGLQNVWNIWWVKKSIVDLHQLPWRTAWLHHPSGTTLVAHTLNPFNGLIGIPLSLALSPVQVHNVAVVTGFVAAGWTAFLLSYDATGAYWPSVAAGAAFTFSGYHFAHAEGHLQLVSLQWIPLFALTWIRLLRAPTVLRALAAAAALGLVILCDYYYFGYCVALAAIFAAHRTVRSGDVLMLVRGRYALPLGTFAVATLLTSGVLVGALLWMSTVDPLSGSHDATQYSTDLLAPFMPGGHSAYRVLTEWYWGRLRGNIHESSVYVGMVVLMLAGYGFARRAVVRIADASLWLVIAVVFFVLSLGPELTYRGASLTAACMPYAWLESLLPPLRLSGCPVRMMVIVSLALSLLAGAGIEAIVRSRPGSGAMSAALVCIVMAIDLWPRAMTVVRPDVPGWVYDLRDSSAPGAVLDLSMMDGPLALYYQTIHEKPMSFGYISRVPRSVADSDVRLVEHVRARRFKTVRDVLGFRYALVRRNGVDSGAGDVRLQDLSSVSLADPVVSVQ